MLRKHTVPIILGAVGITLIAANIFKTRKREGTSDEANGPREDVVNYVNVLIGDVGGTNVRLKLLRMFPEDKNKIEILKELTFYNPQVEKSFESCIVQFLEGVPDA